MLRIAVSWCWSLLALAACSDAEPPGAPNPARNLVFIVVDTLRADHVETYGYTRATSPALQKFADASVIFDRAYSHSPWTLPSVASMLTSLTPRDHGLKQWENRIDGLLTLAQVLAGHGFHTRAHVSHQAFRAKRGEFAAGFAKYDSRALKLGPPYVSVTSGFIANAAIQFLEDPPLERFFMWLHFFDPHTTYFAHAKFPFGDTAVDRYDSEIALTDYHLGRVFESLKATGRDADTLVVVVSDHGEEFQDHGGEGHVVTLYDELLRVPLMIRMPGIERGRVAEVTPLIDLAPTMLQLLGLPVPPEFRGRAIPATARGLLQSGDRPVIAETHRRNNRRGLIRGDWKLIVNLDTEVEELYDLRNDPLERSDLSDVRPERSAALRGELDSYYATPGTEAPVVPLDSESVEALRALGYLD